MSVQLHVSQSILVKPCNKEFHKSPSSGIRVVPCKTTDRHEAITFYKFPNIQTTKIQKQKERLV